MLDARCYILLSDFNIFQYIKPMQLIFFLAVIFLFGVFPANEEEWSRIAGLKIDLLFMTSHYRRRDYLPTAFRLSWLSNFLLEKKLRSNSGMLLGSGYSPAPLYLSRGHGFESQPPILSKPWTATRLMTERSWVWILPGAGLFLSSFMEVQHYWFSLP